MMVTSTSMAPSCRDPRRTSVRSVTLEPRICAGVSRTPLRCGLRSGPTCVGRGNRRDFPWRSERDPSSDPRRGSAPSEVTRPATVVGAGLRRAVPSLAGRCGPGEGADPVDPERHPTLGLVRRAETLKQLARAVVDGGEVPRTLDAPHGASWRRTICGQRDLAVAFGKRAVTVDGVTARVYRRYFGLESGSPASTDRAVVGAGRPRDSPPRSPGMELGRPRPGRNGLPAEDVRAAPELPTHAN